MPYLTAFFLLSLSTLPFLSYKWAKVNAPKRVCVITGTAFGLVISSVSWGLYLGGFLLQFLGLIPALIGGALLLLHGVPGHQLAIFFGIQEDGKIVEGINHVWIEIMNGIFWGLIYGTVGFILDKNQVREVIKRGWSWVVGRPKPIN